jgi:hypothetical protein
LNSRAARLGRRTNVKARFADFRELKDNLLHRAFLGREYAAKSSDTVRPRFCPRNINAALARKRIDLQLSDDDSAGFNYMGWATCSRCFSVFVDGLFSHGVALVVVRNPGTGQEYLFALYRLDRLR